MTLAWSSSAIMPEIATWQQEKSTSADDAEITPFQPDTGSPGAWIEGDGAANADSACVRFLRGDG
jgi:hypothetical protein